MNLSNKQKRWDIFASDSTYVFDFWFYKNATIFANDYHKLLYFFGKIYAWIIEYTGYKVTESQLSYG